MDPSAKLLFMLAVVSIHLFFAMTVLQDKEHRPLWALAYFIAVGFFATLYFRRRLLLRHRRGGVYHGLGYTAVILGVLASALFFFRVGAGGAALPVPLAVGVWLGLAIAAYFFYRVIVLHLDETDADEVAVQVPVAWRLPV